MATTAYPATNTAEDIERFWARVDRLGAWRSHQVDDPCWLWTRGCGNGYGTIYWEGRTENAHRVAWILTYGPIPTGVHVLHRCDVKICCRPSHLFLGTQGDNMRDYTQKGLRQRGEAHPQAKLTATEVCEIRRLGADLPAYTRSRVLGEQFHISPTRVRAIIARRSWTHLP